MTSPEANQPTFDAIPLSADVRKAIDELGYVHPTPVQLAVFEPATRGRNLVVQARTGTGKTASFGLPIVDALVKKGTPHVQALVLTPTRELALQVTREVTAIAKHRGTKVVAVYGGAAMGPQIDALSGGAQVVVGTPGRVLDHIRRGTFDTSHVKVFVLDEADEMLSMGFAKELHAIADALPKERQGLLFSATIPPDIERLATAQLKDPEFVTLSSDQVGALEIQHFVFFTAGDKRQALLRVIEAEDPESAILFCNTKDETERLAEFLKGKGFDADWLNGDLEQRERERVMSATREGRLRFLVATDVAARGIDISHLTHVINADFPESAENYVHRTGRTGRAGRTGTAISLVAPKDIGSLYLLKLTYGIRPIERQLPSDFDLKTRAETDLVQMFVDGFAGREPHPEDLALARRLLTHEAIERVLAGLLRDHLGARPDAKVAASEARRAKAPPPVEQPTPESIAPKTAHAAQPSTHREPAVSRRSERGERADRSDRKPRRGAPHATYAEWEPPRESDDDKPLLSGRHAHEESALPGFTEAPASSEPETVRRAETRAREPRAPRESRESREAQETRDDEAAGFVQIFVNVGRRDGASPGELQRLLTEGAGIERKDTGRIRVRDRNSFVSVKKDDLDKAIAALAGQSLGGRTIIAEKARDRAD